MYDDYDDGNYTLKGYIEGVEAREGCYDEDYMYASRRLGVDFSLLQFMLWFSKLFYIL